MIRTFPEPWTMEQEALNSITIKADGVEIATVYNDDIMRVTAKQRATARLIVAAPRMLRELDKWAAIACSDFPQQCHAGAPCLTCRARLLRAEISRPKRT